MSTIESNQRYIAKDGTLLFVQIAFKDNLYYKAIVDRKFNKIFSLKEIIAMELTKVDEFPEEIEPKEEPEPCCCATNEEYDKEMSSLLTKITGDIQKSQVTED
jgi:hypothetical protein